jgi:hypothetical protein
MQAIVYSLLFVYSIPLLFIFLALYTTDFFAARDNTVYMADAISGSFFSLFRDTFGSIIVPMITAYSIPTRQPDQPISSQTLRLFFTLIGIFLLTVILYAVITYHQDALARFNEVGDDGKLIKDIPKAFFTTITAYGKESLAYVALLLGLSFKKDS